MSLNLGLGFSINSIRNLLRRILGLLVDDSGNYIVDDSGNRIKGDV